jgi:hypothetical protein
MRNLPKKPNEKQKIIIQSVKDYYGSGATPKEISDSKVIALFLMNRKARLQPMTEEQKSDMWAIKENLFDKVYCQSLLHTPVFAI